MGEDVVPRNHGILVDLEEWRLGLGRIKELSEIIITKWALRTADCEGGAVY